MKLFFYFLFFILTLNLASAALNLDKGKLDYELNIGEESCQVVSLSSNDYNGTIKIRDVWAENKDEDNNLNKYTFSALDHQLSIKYIDTVLDFKDSMDFEVCLTADNPGNFKGALVFTPDAKTNVVVEVGTWLFVNVKENIQENTLSNNPGSSSGGGGGGGGGGGSGSSSSGGITGVKTITQSSGLNKEENQLNNETNQTEEEAKTAGITGAVIGLLGKKWTKIIILIIIIITISYLIIYKKRRQMYV